MLCFNAVCLELVNESVWSIPRYIQ